MNLVIIGACLSSKVERVVLDAIKRDPRDVGALDETRRLQITEKRVNVY